MIPQSAWLKARASRACYRHVLQRLPDAGRGRSKRVARVCPHRREKCDDCRRVGRIRGRIRMGRYVLDKANEMRAGTIGFRFPCGPPHRPAPRAPVPRQRASTAPMVRRLRNLRWPRACPWGRTGARASPVRLGPVRIRAMGRAKATFGLNGAQPSQWFHVIHTRCPDFSGRCVNGTGRTAPDPSPRRTQIRCKQRPAGGATAGKWRTVSTLAPPAPNLRLHRGVRPVCEGPVTPPHRALVEFSYSPRVPKVSSD